MIKLSMPMKQEFAIQILEATKQFKFIKKEGIHLYFDTELSDVQQAIKAAKLAIKSTPTGSVLF